MKEIIVPILAVPIGFDHQINSYDRQFFPLHKRLFPGFLLLFNLHYLFGAQAHPANLLLAGGI